MLETAERFTDVEKEPAVQQFLLLVGGLRALSSTEHARGAGPRRLLRSLAVAGYAPSFEVCARCGRRAAYRIRGRRRWDVVPHLPSAEAASPSKGTVDLMAALLSGDWATADAAADRDRREAAGIVAAYLQWHLERGLRSLRLVERTTQAQRGGGRRRRSAAEPRRPRPGGSGAVEIATIGLERA